MFTPGPFIPKTGSYRKGYVDGVRSLRPPAEPALNDRHDIRGIKNPFERRLTCVVATFLLMFVAFLVSVVNHGCEALTELINGVGEDMQSFFSAAGKAWKGNDER